MGVKIVLAAVLLCASLGAQTSGRYGLSCGGLKHWHHGATMGVIGQRAWSIQTEVVRTTAPGAGFVFVGARSTPLRHGPGCIWWLNPVAPWLITLAWNKRGGTWWAQVGFGLSNVAWRGLRIDTQALVDLGGTFHSSNAFFVVLR